MPLEPENDYEYSHNPTPKCPYCDHEENISDDPIVEYYEEGEITMSCGNCSKDYTCYVAVEFSYSTHNQ